MASAQSLVRDLLGALWDARYRGQAEDELALPTAEEILDALWLASFLPVSGGRVRTATNLSDEATPNHPWFEHQ